MPVSRRLRRSGLLAALIVSAPLATPSSAEVAAPIAATPRPPLKVAAPPANAERAVESGVYPARLPALSGYPRQRLAAALDAFGLSCAKLPARQDISGLTRPDDWRKPCEEAANWSRDDAAGFFARHFTAVQVGDGRAYATGYFEPQIEGARRRINGYNTPILGKPSDIIEADLGAFFPEYAGKRLRGRLKDGQIVPYDSRAEIEAGSLVGKAPVIGWAADPAEFFFLQVQGSGIVRAPDGSVMRVGFAGANGRPYTSIGKLMLDRGLIGPGEATMQGIVGWLKRHPREARDIMQANESFIFFREITGPGPVGAMGVPVAPRISVAADPRFVPLGAPVLLSMDRERPNGLWIAQDTGSAIKGANRFDTFWGAGDDARAVAGGMAARGSALVLLPNAAAQRLAR